MTSARESRCPTIGVISDDLTGASIAAARLATHGLRTRVVWSTDTYWGNYDAVVVDTRGRDEPDEALPRVREWARAFRQAGIPHLEMRVDSTLRGRPATELSALLGGAEIEAAILVAVMAYPGAGRRTTDGQQVIRNLTGPESSVDLAEVLFPGRQTRVVQGSVVSHGAPAIVEEISAAIDQGVETFVVDGRDEKDLVDTATAVSQLSRSFDNLVTISSGAWLRYYPVGRDGYVLAVVGSPTETNRTQLRSLLAHKDASLSVVSLGQALKDPAAALQGDPATVVLETVTEANDRDVSAETGEAVHGLLTANTAPPCLGLVVTGGRSAGAIVDRLQATSFDVTYEMEPLCSYGRLVGGPFDGLPMATKGGQVGGGRTIETLIQAVANPWRPRAGEHRTS